mmetsp:Transcript_25782/g.47594  ORF Transcript_25782/g.47594 Transcript_25782/m.47594 type:complete len:143 (+) Transcript_25782:1-429(+)
MSDRLEHTKRRADENSRALSKQELTMAANKSKAEESSRRLGKQVQVVEDKLIKVNQALTEHDKVLGTLREDWKLANTELGTIRSELQEEKKTNQEKEATMRKMNVRQAIDVLWQKIETSNEQSAKMLEELHEAEGGVQDLKQ